MGRRVGQKLVTVFIAALILVAAFLLAGRLLGGNVYAVLSGSMEPTLHTGCLIYVKSVEPAELEAGDIITYAISEDMVATHRITKIASDNAAGDLWFTTKGDANDSEDASPVHSKNVIGVPSFNIPYLGYAITFLKTGTGRVISIALIAVLLLLGVMPAFKSSAPNNEKQQQQQKHQQQQQ